MNITDFRDPLFGIIVFFILLFIIVFVSYWWRRFKVNEDHRYLNKFIENFNTLPAQDELKVLILKEKISDRSWLLLAQAYFQNGEYEKCIEIYQLLLENQKESVKRKETLFLLGQTYFKAGFLERAKEIFLYILKRYPRTPQALRYLMLVYEQLQEYSLAKEVLEPLIELKKETPLDTIYLEALNIKHDKNLSQNEKEIKLIEIHKKEKLTHYIFEYLFIHNYKLAWKRLNKNLSYKISDILWNLPDEKIDFDVVREDRYLTELYSAKGIINDAKSSSVFEFDLLIKLKEYDKATIQFEYLCSECKNVFPFSFHRCPKCYGIDTLIPETILTKRVDEDNFSFQ